MVILFHIRRRHFQSQTVPDDPPVVPTGNWTFAAEDFPSSVTWSDGALGTSLYRVCPKHDESGVIALSTYLNAYFDAGSTDGFDLSTYSRTSRATSRFGADVLHTHDGLRFLLQESNGSSTICMRTASTAYDLTTLSSSNESSLNPFGGNANGESFCWAFISPDGTHLMLQSEDGEDNIFLKSYTLGTAWNLGTASATPSVLQLAALSGVAWVNQSSGTQIIQAKYSTSTTYDIVLHTLGTAWDASSITSTVTLANIATANYGAITSICVNGDGDKILLTLSNGKYAVIDLSEEA